MIRANCDPGRGVIACHKLLEPIAVRGSLSVHDVQAQAGDAQPKPVGAPACFQPHLATLFVHKGCRAPTT